MRRPTKPIGEHCSRLADQYDFTVFADECYADIYFDKPPVCALTARYRSDRKSFARLLTFHSLSKRSGLPGLRSGIVAGDPKLMAKFRGFRNYAGPAGAHADPGGVRRGLARRGACRRQPRRSMPSACAGPSAIWATACRFRKPDGGFFLWLDVGNGEEAALKLWREAGIRVLPGAYMGREIEPGKPQTNPGFRYIRVALVSDLSTIQAALGRMGEILERGPHEPGSDGGRHISRARGAGSMADALADARRAFVQAMNTAVLRGAGAAPVPRIGRGASWRSSPTIPTIQPQQCRFGASATNLLGGLGATAADFLLQTFGFAAVAALAPPAIWGARALFGRNISQRGGARDRMAHGHGASRGGSRTFPVALHAARQERRPDRRWVSRAFLRTHHGELDRRRYSACLLLMAGLPLVVHGNGHALPRTLACRRGSARRHRACRLVHPYAGILRRT